MFACAIFLKYESNKYANQKQIIKSYIDDLYNTNCTVNRVSFTHNDDGFTGGLYQYYFKVYDSKSNMTYYVEYHRYNDLSEKTVNDVIIKTEYMKS